VLPSHSHRACTFITVAAFWPKVVLAFRSALPVCWCGSWLPRHATVPLNSALFLPFIFICFPSAFLQLFPFRSTLTAPFYGRVWVWVWLFLFLFLGLGQRHLLCFVCFDWPFVAARLLAAGTKLCNIFVAN